VDWLIDEETKQSGPRRKKRCFTNGGDAPREESPDQGAGETGDLIGPKKKSNGCSSGKKRKKEKTGDESPRAKVEE